MTVLARKRRISSLEKVRMSRRGGILLKFALVLAILAALFVISAALSSQFDPDTYSSLALLGLAYPYLLYLNLFFVAIFLIIRKWWFVIPLAAILLTGPSLFSYLQYNPSGSALNESNPQLKILSYNVRLFNLYDWENNKRAKNAIIAFIDAEHPDVMCFQEFFYRPNYLDFNTKDTLLDLFEGYHVKEGYTHFLKANQRFGLVTISKYPIVGSGEIKFENDINNNVIYTDLEVESDTVRVYNAHLASIRFQQEDYRAIGDEESADMYGRTSNQSSQILRRLTDAFEHRSVQIQKLKNHIDTSPYPIVLCGDFNDTPNSFCYKTINQDLVDAFKISGKGNGGTYIGKFPSYRIDYIFHSKNIHSYNYKKYGIDYSDHHPISCVFELKN